MDSEPPARQQMLLWVMSGEAQRLPACAVPFILAEQSCNKLQGAVVEPRRERYKLDSLAHGRENDDV